MRFLALFCLKLCCHIVWDSGRDCICIWENPSFCPQKSPGFRLGLCLVI
nr:MAG TPA: hypothetical protein [Caudoviricetes sp.]